jgi:FkbM family methyltransferase
LTENLTYTVRWGLAKGMKRRGGLQFIPQVTRLRPEENHLKSLSLTGKTVYDIGGFEGIFTLFFARSAGPQGRVVTFEPNPVNQGRIEKNVALNKLTNVTLVKKGLGSKSSTATLVIPGDLREAGTVNTDAQKRYEGSANHREYTIQIEALDDLVASLNLPKPDFIKLDIEGYEIEALAGMKKVLSTHKPQLHIEVHTHVFDDVAQKKEYLKGLLEALWGHSYSVTCVETGAKVDAMPTDTLFEETHFYCV